MDPSRISGAYDDSIDNLMEDMGVNAQIEIGKLYYIRNGKLKTEAESWIDYGRKILGYQVSAPSVSWLTSIKRTVSTFSTGEYIKDALLNYVESHVKSIVTVSKNIINSHKKLTKDDDIHKHNLLRNFTLKIQESIIGLENLRETYRAKKEERFVSRMGIILGQLRDQITENNTILRIVADHDQGGALDPVRGGKNK
jgi:hypothetical protein